MTKKLQLDYILAVLIGFDMQTNRKCSTLSSVVFPEHYHILFSIIIIFVPLQQEAERANNEDILSKFETSPLYFSRTRGLFRECFHGEKDNAPKIGGKINFYQIRIFFS